MLEKRGGDSVYPMLKDKVIGSFAFTPLSIKDRVGSSKEEEIAIFLLIIMEFEIMHRNRNGNMKKIY